MLASTLFKKYRWLALLAAAFCAPAVFAQPQTEASGTDTAQESMKYIGAPFRVGAGYQSKNQWRGELLYVFRETDNTAWIAEGYATARTGAGGRFSFNWQPADDKEAMVRKLFTAFDQNRHHDRKVTLGAGLEGERWSGSLYGSAGVTGSRKISDSFFSSTDTISGIEDNHGWYQDITTTTHTRIFERAYDWGIGARAGRFYDSWALRWFGGVDYEWGKQSTSQVTGTLGIEKYFVGTPHSLALVGEVFHKRGDHEIKKNDQRIMLMYRLSFGGPSYRSAQQYRDVQVEVPAVVGTVPAVTPPPPPAQAEQPARRMVKTTATAAADVFFKFDSAQLQPEASRALNSVFARLQSSDIEGNIYITGHTCNIGSAAYNQGLSERRAQSVLQYFVSKGMAADKMIAEGKGLHEPRYPNDREGRPKNRRVDIEYVTFEEKEVTENLPAITPPPPAAPTVITTAEPRIEWRREEITSEPTWVRRALRTPPEHKQTVDVYRKKESTTTVEEGERVIILPPVAVDDWAVAGFNQPVDIDVLANDYDPQGLEIRIVSFTSPRHGTVTQNGDILTYKCHGNYIGWDSFQYTITNGYGVSTATVTVYADP